MNHDDSKYGGRISPPFFLWPTDPSLEVLFRIRLLFLFAVILFLAYSNTFHAAWQLDDKPNILTNDRIQITELSAKQIWQSMTAKPGSGGLYRPAACVTLALNWFFGQDDVFGYHVVNFIIHLGTAWALFLVLNALFLSPRLEGRYPCHQRLLMAGTAAILWALNPVQIQAVTYIVQRMASLAALFAVLSVYFYLRARMAADSRKGPLLFLAALFCYLLGLLSKENVVLLPLAVPVLEVLFFPVNRSWGAYKKIAAGTGLSIGICVMVIVLLRPDSIDFIFNYYHNRPFTLIERLLSEQRILLFYLSLLIFPAPGRLSIEHDIVISSSIFSPWTTAAALGVNTLLIIGAVKVGRKQPLFSLAILFFYLNHIVESTILPLELIFEHRNYLPSAFLFLPLAQIINFLIKKNCNERRLLTVVVVLVSSLFGLNGYATYMRNNVWQSEQSLWLDALTKAPRSARPMATIAILLAWGEHPTPAKYRKALELTERTLTLRMARNLEAEQLGNMASIYEKLGQIDQAIEYYQKALSLSPDKVGNRYNLAKTLIFSGDFQPAHSELETILSQGAVHADYYNLLGFTDLWLGQPNRALPMLQRALKLAPGRPDILLAIGNCLSSMGYYQRAQWFLRLAERTGGRDVIVLLNLIQNAFSHEDMAMARKSLHRMLALYPLYGIWHRLEPSTENYRTAPLNRPLLKSFIASEIKTLPSFGNNDSSR